MSNWSRSPRGGNGAETAQALNEWREIVTQEKELGHLSLKQLGLKQPQHDAPAPGTMRSSPPEHLAHLFEWPRTTTGEAQIFTKAPKPPPWAFLMADPNDKPNKAHNRKRFDLDLNHDRKDHEIFPKDERTAGRVKIRQLKAQVRPPRLQSENAPRSHCVRACRPLRADSRTDRHVSLSPVPPHRCRRKSRRAAMWSRDSNGTRSLAAPSTT